MSSSPRKSTSASNLLLHQHHTLASTHYTHDETNTSPKKNVIRHNQPASAFSDRRRMSASHQSAPALDQLVATSDDIEHFTSSSARLVPARPSFSALPARSNSVLVVGVGSLSGGGAGQRSPVKACSGMFLPSHSRSGSISGAHTVAAAAAQGGSGRASPVSSPLASAPLPYPDAHMSRSVSAPGAQSNSHLITVSGGSGSSSPTASPHLKPLTLPFTPTSSLPSHLVTLTLPTSNSAGGSTDLLSQSTNYGIIDVASSFCFSFWRALYLLFCCFHTPSSYDALHASSLSSSSTVLAGGSPPAALVSPFSAYNENARRARQAQRKRHRASVAAAQHKEQQETQDAATNNSIITYQQQQHMLFLSRDSDEDDSSCDESESDDRISPDSRSCCQQPCFPRCCHCCACYTKCCTVRRSACISVYFIMITVAILFAVYYQRTVKTHGWKWPPSF